MQFSRVVRISLRVIPDYTSAAFMPRSRRLSTWSFIKAINGVTTRQIPFIAITGT